MRATRHILCSILEKTNQLTAAVLITWPVSLCCSLSRCPEPRYTTHPFNSIEREGSPSVPAHLSIEVLFFATTKLFCADPKMSAILFNANAPLQVSSCTHAPRLYLTRSSAPTSTLEIADPNHKPKGEQLYPAQTCPIVHLLFTATILFARQLEGFFSCWQALVARRQNFARISR